MEDDKKKKNKEERQAERQAQREERQARREEHREYVKENGTAIGNELRALGKGLKEDWQNDVNALKGRRSGDPAAKTTEETSEAPAPETTQTQTTATEVVEPTEEPTGTDNTAANAGGDGPKRAYKTRARKTEEIANDINANSDADFVQRLKDKDRKTIPNWENSEQVSTHKMSYAKQDGKTYVYPNVQNINGELHDFTNPEYGHDKWDALDSALKNGDAVQVRNRRAAERFTTQYKDYYPKGDGQDVDGETGVVSQETGDDNKRTPLPEMPEQGDTSALQGKVETEQQPSGIDLSKREYGENPETEARNRQFVNNADELEKPDESALSPLTQPKEGIDLSKREYPTDGDLTPEQVVSKYGGDAERLKEAGFNPDGTPLSVDDEDNDESALPQPPAIPNAEDDETVKGIEQANATRDKAWSDYINFYKDFLKKQEEYDRQRQERDSRNAFWRSIGEVGASLVNLLGVSGAFSGRNAYGRGAYSSMQKFDLTTSKLTDKMWADIDKRKERMDELKQKMMENKLKWQEVVAGGQEKGGTAKGAAADKQYTREYTQYKDQLSAQQAANQLEYLKGKAAADAVLAEIKMKNDKEIAKIRAAGRSGGGGGGSSKTPITLNLTYPTADGEKSFTSRYDVLEAAMKVNFGRLADCLARALGYNDYAGFSADKPTNYKYNGDNQIEKSLSEYFTTTKYVAMNNISNDKMTELLNWAYKALGLTQEGGELIENAVKAYAPIVDVMNAMNGGGGGGNDTEDEEEFPDYDGAFQGVN